MRGPEIASIELGAPGVTAVAQPVSSSYADGCCLLKLPGEFIQIPQGTQSSDTSDPVVGGEWTGPGIGTGTRPVAGFPLAGEGTGVRSDASGEGHVEARPDGGVEVGCIRGGEIGCVLAARETGEGGFRLGDGVREPNQESRSGVGELTALAVPTSVVFLGPGGVAGGLAVGDTGGPGGKMGEGKRGRREEGKGINIENEEKEGSMVIYVC
ncbi:hypothetical protein PRIPAC_77767 [Pristionchus pacificus]|uniref:Uncharacterized protein n=1 Tax=Pristionchus pacificus TaxID=54126 RepID=A0A2A6CLW6_PRIPA|nr:hypothetical protein PRIPAC_77767 [Pristionchus pacificus]|eukprot:PDM79192.1 hypothetical protein PRIPAC_31771 [Pristionchus pacificus]